MIAFNIATCILSLAGMVAVALILEDQLRTLHRLALCGMAATMVMSTWAAVAGMGGTDGWVFIGFRCGLVVHLFCEYTPRLRAALVELLKAGMADRLPPALRWLQPLADTPPPYTANPPPPAGRPH